jgi:hypothetical protein
MQPTPTREAPRAGRATGATDGVVVNARRRPPSGAPIPEDERRGLPDPDAPIVLKDGRRLVCIRRMPDRSDAVPGEMAGGSAWEGPKGLHVIATIDATDAWGPLLHVSLSYGKPSRMPSWADIRMVKDAFYGDVDACMIMPVEADYVNARENCFNLWQLPRVWGIR